MGTENIEDWVKSKVHEAELNRILQQAKHEEQLYEKSAFGCQHAQSRYGLFLKNQNIDCLRYYYDVKNASESYLARVPEENTIKNVSIGLDTDT